MHERTRISRSPRSPSKKNLAALPPKTRIVVRAPLVLQVLRKSRSYYIIDFRSRGGSRRSGVTQVELKHADRRHRLMKYRLQYFLLFSCVAIATNCGGPARYKFFVFEDPENRIRFFVNNVPIEQFERGGWGDPGSAMYWGPRSVDDAVNVVAELRSIHKLFTHLRSIQGRT